MGDMGYAESDKLECCGEDGASWGGVYGDRGQLVEGNGGVGLRDTVDVGGDAWGVQIGAGGEKDGESVMENL
jgi:hypothetical protein